MGTQLRSKGKRKQNKIADLFSKETGVATVRNYAGAPAYLRGDEEALVRTLTVGTFEPTYYVGAKELAGEALTLFKKFAAERPDFLAHAIVYARERGLMRIAPITALVCLSAGQSDNAKQLFRRIFPRVIQTPGDLQDFLTLCKQGTIRGMGKTVQHAVQEWLKGISQYHVIKYGSDKQEMSLRDMYRIARPSTTGVAAAIAEYVTHYGRKPEASISEVIDQILGYELFKAAARDQHYAQAREYVKKYRLPWEVVTSQLPANFDTWDAILKQLPYMALLRNLNNLAKYHVLDDGSNLLYVVNTLSDPERVRKGKQFPFAYISALKALQVEDKSVRSVLAHALDEALNLSFANMPDLGERVLIANDVSGSMATSVSDKGNMSAAEVAAIFAAALFKKAEQADVISFNDRAHVRSLDRKERLSVLADEIKGLNGGTNLSAPLQYAMSREQVYDTCVFITDSESWVQYLTYNVSDLHLIRRYKQTINPDVKMFFLQVVPYPHAVVPPEEPNCFYLYGWNSSVVDYIGAMSAGGASQVAEVGNTQI